VAARKSADGPLERRITMDLGLHADLAPARLAKRTGKTRRALVEELILSEQDRVLSELPGREADAYLDHVVAGDL
jgi:hypothetical protein